jgi:hypothetical protein
MIFLWFLFFCLTGEIHICVSRFFKVLAHFGKEMLLLGLDVSSCPAGLHRSDFVLFGFVSDAGEEFTVNGNVTLALA